MITCKNCRWWESDWLGDGWKRCTSPKIVNRADDPERELPCPATDEIYSANTPDGMSYIGTGPNFGCVHGEEKDATSQGEENAHT